MRTIWLGAMGFVVLGWLTVPTQAQEVCPGDCDGSVSVAINELISCVNISLGLAPLSTCTACDVDGDGMVEINELIQAVNAALEGCPDGEGFCGDGLMNMTGETCDDGNNFGGDGCAANCTCRQTGTECDEDVRVGVFDPARTIAFVQGEGFSIGPLNIEGSQTFRTGQVRNEDALDEGGDVVFKAGEMPAAIRSAELIFEPVRVPGAVCACVRGIPVDDLFGPGISGSGAIGCNTEGLTDVDYRLIQDHNTNPGDPNNTVVGTPDDPECNDQVVLPGGTISRACREQVDAACLDAEMHPHEMVCNSPRNIALSGGPAGRGSAFILNNTAIGQLRDNGACDTSGNACEFEDYGPDCLPCTDDDLEKGEANNLPTTTGTADSALFNANNGPGVLDKDQMCGGGGTCQTVVTGTAFDCDALINNPSGGLSGGSLAVAFPQLDASIIGDNVTTTVFFNQ